MRLCLVEDKMSDIKLKRDLEKLRQHKSITYKWKWEPTDAERKQIDSSPPKRKRGLGN